MKPELFLIALWKHECERVFLDKLINKKDKETATQIIEDIALESFKDHQSEIEEKILGKRIFFCDFLQYPVRLIEEDEEAEEEEEEDDEILDYEREYEGIMDIEKLRLKCLALLRKYNKDNPSKRMDLVLFDDALAHLLKVSRII